MEITTTLATTVTGGVVLQRIQEMLPTSTWPWAIAM